ncbi:MAG: hypothetical protein IPJ00_21505 [Saprospirales bacterium]|nr:hypothetical protein [Saprospirales bacterium]
MEYNVQKNTSQTVKGKYGKSPAAMVVVKVNYGGAKSIPNDRSKRINFIQIGRFLDHAFGGGFFALAVFQNRAEYLNFEGVAYFESAPRLGRHTVDPPFFTQSVHYEKSSFAARPRRLPEVLTL